MVCASGAWGQGDGDRALGQYLAAECVACHQVNGRPAGAIPPIAGLPEDYFSQSLHDYKTGKRRHDIMNAIATRLSPEDIAALATYFASIKP